MRKRTIASLAIAAIGLAVFGAWATSPDPRGNTDSFEERPIAPGIASLDDALTLSRFTGADGAVHTLLVTGYDGKTVAGLDLADLGAPLDHDPFVVIANLDRNALKEAAASPTRVVEIPLEDLLPSGPMGARHLGSGTNFPEHAEETDSNDVFMFPKFGTATPAITQVSAPQGSLLDYEVEICSRFDRDITSAEDFDAAVKGLFLCADFTDRITLIRLVDPGNLDSGYGFSDAKSGTGYFPTGPFLVIPNDWDSFVPSVRMTTEVNGEPRQDARGGEMIMDFRSLTQKALGDMQNPRFLYGQDFVKLAPNAAIEADMALMSGTGEGVIFTPPSRGDIIEGTLGYVAGGGPFGSRAAWDALIAEFVENELAAGHYLKPGDIVKYRSSLLGEIRVDIGR